MSSYPANTVENTLPSVTIARDATIAALRGRSFSSDI